MIRTIQPTIQQLAAKLCASQFSAVSGSAAQAVAVQSLSQFGLGYLSRALSPASLSFSRHAQSHMQLLSNSLSSAASVVSNFDWGFCLTKTNIVKGYRTEERQALEPKTHSHSGGGSSLAAIPI